MRRHSSTYRLPLEHFEAEEAACLGPVPTTAYDIPSWSDPKVGRDQYCQVAKALYSVPAEFDGTRLIGRRLRARADSSTVRLYLDRFLVKVHGRKPPGGVSTDAADFPAHKLACARRDVDFLKKQGYRHGEAVGRYVEALLDCDLPWTRMRRVYLLLSLCKRYGSERVARCCELALAAEMFEIKRLERMVKLGPSDGEPPPPKDSTVVPLGRYLRPKEQFTLPLAAERSAEEESE